MSLCPIFFPACFEILRKQVNTENSWIELKQSPQLR